MTRKRRTLGQRRAAQQRRRRNWLLAVVPGVIAAAALTWVLVGKPGADADDTILQPEPTTDVSRANAAGVEVDRPSVDLGQIPLDTPVQHDFVLRNISEARVSPGQARIEVLEGC